MLSNGLYPAINSQTNLEIQMERLAYDMANATSPGHKPRYMMETVHQENTGFKKYLSFALNNGEIRESHQGAFQPTNNPLNVAIMGKGFFVIQTDNGQAYTRDGTFTTGPEGNLSTASGRLVLNDGGAPIALPPGEGPLSILPDGTVLHGKDTVGRLDVVYFENENALQEIGENLVISDEAPQKATKYFLESGGYESSTVDPITSSTKLLEILRSYQRIDDQNKMYFKQMEIAMDTLLTHPPAG